MKILQKNLKKGEVKLKVESKDDLWYLGQIIDPGDTVTAKTERKIKLSKEGERSGAVIKKIVTMQLCAEKTEFTADSLKISGKVASGHEDIARGSYHTLTVDDTQLNSILSVQKERWLGFQLEKLREAERQKSKTLVCVLDREQACFALLKSYGFELLSEFHGEVEKKADIKKIKNDFYTQVISQLEEYEKRHEASAVIIASPAFFKEDLMKQLHNEQLKKKIVLATCNHVGKEGITEVLKRPEVSNALRKERVAEETNAVEAVLAEIAKDGAAVYGKKETAAAAESGAVRMLLVTSAAVHDARAAGSYKDVDIMMRNVDDANGSIMIIASEHDAGRRLDGLGGIAALLRYKTQYA